jgi:ClpP class serine protease
MMLPDRPFTDEEREVVRREMRAIYDTFLHVVALRKGREVEEVEIVAGGRVFSARRALENDLVDRIGTRADLLDALATRLKCRAERIRLVHLGREGPLEGVELPHAAGSVAVGVAQTTRLIARDRIAAELPFYMIMGSP